MKFSKFTCILRTFYLLDEKLKIFLRFLTNFPNISLNLLRVFKNFQIHFRIKIVINIILKFHEYL